MNTKVSANVNICADLQKYLMISGTLRGDEKGDEKGDASPPSPLHCFSLFTGEFMTSENVAVYFLMFLCFYQH